MLILQERLLTKGLNLNAAKTKLEDGKTGIEELRSKAYEAFDYGMSDEGDEGEAGSAAPLPVYDKPFDEFGRQFLPDEQLKEEKDAKDFCQFLGKLLPLQERQPDHIETLKVILNRWHGSSRHASWRLVESIVRNECLSTTRASAEKVLLDCLGDSRTSTYAKYRLLHHLVRRRPDPENRVRRYINLMTADIKEAISKLLPSYLKEPAFELNIIALCTMKALGASPADLETEVRECLSKPVPGPIRNALMRAGSAPSPVVAEVDALEVEEQEDAY